MPQHSLVRWELIGWGEHPHRSRGMGDGLGGLQMRKWKKGYIEMNFLFIFLATLLKSMLLVFVVCFVVVVVSRQGISVQPRLSWNLLCRPGWPRTQKSACLCLPSGLNKGMCHHCLAQTTIIQWSCEHLFAR
jgi:hypothetical protein